MPARHCQDGGIRGGEAEIPSSISKRPRRAPRRHHHAAQNPPPPVIPTNGMDGCPRLFLSRVPRCVEWLGKTPASPRPSTTHHLATGLIGTRDRCGQASATSAPSMKNSRYTIGTHHLGIRRPVFWFQWSGENTRSPTTGNLGHGGCGDEETTREAGFFTWSMCAGDHSRMRSDEAGTRHQ